MKTLIALLLFVGFAQAQQKSFSEAALNENFFLKMMWKLAFQKYFNSTKGKPYL